MMITGIAPGMGVVPGMAAMATPMAVMAIPMAGTVIPMVVMVTPMAADTLILPTVDMAIHKGQLTQAHSRSHRPPRPLTLHILRTSVHRMMATRI